VIKVTRSRYQSNVKGLGKELNEKLERIVSRAARDGARRVSQLSDPRVQAFGSDGSTSAGVVSSRVFVARNDWWAQIFDTGSLGKRQIPLEQPGRRESRWTVERRGKTYTAHRSAKALASGGIRPQYFLIRSRRHAEHQLAGYLRRGL
jgi:hypothetical protein